MASRKEQKEALRREREAREAEAKAAERRRRLIGYGAGGAIALIAVVVVAVLLLSGGDDGGDGKAGGNSEVFPAGGEFPVPETADFEDAAKAAGCELKSFPAKSREHTQSLDDAIKYPSSPPTSGKHFVEATQDGIFEEPPDPKQLVHTMEHGRVIVWVKRTLPEQARADLRAFVEDDPYHMVLTPDNTDMPYDVAATAWNADPQPNGTGRLLGCPRFDEKVFEALAAFREEHRDNGPEAVQ